MMMMRDLDVAPAPRHSTFGILHGSALRLACVLAVISPAAAADWPQFLGPNRDGIADASESVSQGFGPGGAKVLWTHPLGSGFAGPAVAAGKLVVVHRVEDQVIVQALDAKDGKEVWRFAKETKYADSMGFDNGPRACPTIADGKVVVHGADGVVQALSFEDGKPMWTYDTVKEAGSPQGFFGRACAPLAAGSNVVITAGGKNSKGPTGLVALGLADGKVAWQSVSDEASYASPMFWDRQTSSMLVCWMRNQLVFVDSTDGKQIAATRLRSEMGASVNAAQPVRCGDGVARWIDFVAAPLTKGRMLLTMNEADPRQVAHLLPGTRPAD